MALNSKRGGCFNHTGYAFCSIWLLNHCFEALWLLLTGAVDSSHLRLVSTEWISTVDSTKQEQEDPEQETVFMKASPKSPRWTMPNWRLSFLLTSWEGFWGWWLLLYFYKTPLSIRDEDVSPSGPLEDWLSRSLTSSKKGETAKEDDSGLFAVRRPSSSVLPLRLNSSVQTRSHPVFGNW